MNSLKYLDTSSMNFNSSAIRLTKYSLERQQREAAIADIMKTARFKVRPQIRPQSKRNLLLDSRPLVPTSAKPKTRLARILRAVMPSRTTLTSSPSSSSPSPSSSNTYNQKTGQKRSASLTVSLDLESENSAFTANSAGQTSLPTVQKVVNSQKNPDKFITFGDVAKYRLGEMSKLKLTHKLWKKARTTAVWNKEKLSLESTYAKLSTAARAAK